ncbi:MAG: peptidoglycan DD-metalloendopeptidase family protein [Flavobacteriales bacterium]|nr:peptidoglycan DD-metalloendopeptidase family protein [Flavobacteriales bacterium]
MIRVVSIFFLLAILGSISVQAQKKTDLEKQKKQLLQDIQFTNKLLNETEEDKKHTLNELSLLRSKINKRQELINTILRETELINARIEETHEIVRSLKEDLDRLKGEYAKMLYYTYKNHSQYDRLMFILSSDNFNQAYKRIKYFQQYAKHRQQQAVAIETTRKSLEHRSDELAEKKLKMAYLVEDKEKEKIVLSEEKEQQDELVQSLNEKEDQLKQQLKKKQRDAKKLERAIARVIEEEIRKAKLKAEKTGGTITKSGMALTPKELKLSSKFHENQGKFPWPSERGIITSTFGEHPHPTLRGIRTVNNGIDITTDKGAKARVIFEGIVRHVISIPGAHKAVLVRHGEFLSVYTNLENVSVKSGDVVVMKQEIGSVVTSREDGKTILHFEIWKGTSKLNPSSWIVRKR